MKDYDATEQAFKNGYEKGKQEVAREIFEEFDKLIITLEIGDNEKASVLDYNKYTELEKKYIGEKK